MGRGGGGKGNGRSRGGGRGQGRGERGEERGRGGGRRGRRGGGEGEREGSGEGVGREWGENVGRIENRRSPPSGGMLERYSFIVLFHFGSVRCYGRDKRTDEEGEDVGRSMFSFSLIKLLQLSSKRKTTTLFTTYNIKWRKERVKGEGREVVGGRGSNGERER